MGDFPFKTQGITLTLNIQKLIYFFDGMKNKIIFRSTSSYQNYPISIIKSTINFGIINPYLAVPFIHMYFWC